MIFSSGLKIYSEKNLAKGARRAKIKPAFPLILPDPNRAAIPGAMLMIVFLCGYYAYASETMGLGRNVIIFGILGFAILHSLFIESRRKHYEIKIYPDQVRYQQYAWDGRGKTGPVRTIQLSPNDGFVICKVGTKGWSAYRYGLYLNVNGKILAKGLIGIVEFFTMKEALDFTQKTLETAQFSKTIIIDADLEKDLLEMTGSNFEVKNIKP